MPNKMSLEEKVDALREKAKELDLACIVYAFDERGGGFDYNADTGDAIVAIKRIIERFGINIEALAYSLRK